MTIPRSFSHLATQQMFLVLLLLHFLVAINIRVVELSTSSSSLTPPPSPISFPAGLNIISYDDIDFDIDEALNVDRRFKSIYYGYYQDKRVAVKFFPLNLIHAEFGAIREMTALASFNHPCIHKLMGISFDYTDFVLLAMEYVEGITLKELALKINNSSVQRSDQLASLFVPQLIADLLSALDHIHQQGIVHNDLHDRNILIDEASGRAYIIDFDNSKSIHELPYFDGDFLGVQRAMENLLYRIPDDYFTTEFYRVLCSFASGQYQDYGNMRQFKFFSHPRLPVVWRGDPTFVLPRTTKGPSLILDSDF